MNVIQIRNMLREGKSPCNGKQVHLKEKQIETLAATVPNIKIYNPNCTKYYFPEAGVFLSTQYYPGGIRSSGNTSGILFDMAPDHKALFHEDGTPKFVADDKGMPVVASMGDYSRMNAVYQMSLWLDRKPYRVRVEGYTSKYDKCPRTDYGSAKRVTVFDGDYKDVYFSIEPFHRDNSGVSQAIIDGGYDGSVIPVMFEERIQDVARKERERFEYMYNFKKFVRGNPVEKYNEAVARFNEDIETCEKFLKMARELKKDMKSGSDLFEKLPALKDAAGMKSSELYRNKLALEQRAERRDGILNGPQHNRHYRFQTVAGAVRSWRE